MEITYKNEKLKRLCEDESSKSILTRKYGSDVATNLLTVISFLKRCDNLNDVPHYPPFNRHKLDGSLKGYFAISLNKQYRLIFKPDNNGIIIEDFNTFGDK